MRKTWFAAWAAAGMAGCAGPANPNMPGGLGATNPPAAGTMAIGKPSGWTERITAPLKNSMNAMGLGGPRSPRPQKAELPSYEPLQESPELYLGMAQMSHRGGDLEHARQLYQKALAMDPNHLDALLGAARMEDREGRLDVAMTLYQRAVAAHPKSAAALNDLALCHARMGNLTAARDALEEAIRLEPRKPLYRNNVAKVLVELNQLDQAANHLTAVHPVAAAHYNLGVLLIDRGRDAEATHYLSKALAVDPSMVQARALLAEKSGPTINPPNVQQSLAQTTPILRPGSPESRETILPTPEIVATIPWSPPSSASSTSSLTNSGSASTNMARPELGTQSSSQPMLLLPPVR